MHIARLDNIPENARASYEAQQAVDHDQSFRNKRIALLQGFSHKGEGGKRWSKQEDEFHSWVEDKIGDNAKVIALLAMELGKNRQAKELIADYLTQMIFDTAEDYIDQRG